MLVQLMYMYMYYMHPTILIPDAGNYDYSHNYITQWGFQQNHEWVGSWLLKHLHKWGYVYQSNAELPQAYM